MITTFIAMQNAINSRNNAILQMYVNTNRSMRSLSFGQQAQMLQMDTFELQNHKNAAKISFLNKWLEALNDQLKSSIERSVPKYSGISTKK